MRSLGRLCSLALYVLAAGEELAVGEEEGDELVRAYCQESVFVLEH